MIERVPREWFDNKDEKLNFFMIVELGLIERIERAVALDQTSGKMWPLIHDDSQLHLLSEGPWLIQVDPDRCEQPGIDTLANASHAWIAAYSKGEQLNRQLAPAICCVSPTQEVGLLRFYCPEIIKTLISQVEYPWFDEIFANLASWSYRSENGKFRTTFESPLTTKSGNSDGWILEVDECLWSKLVGNPEVDMLISNLAKDVPEVFDDLNGAMKRQRVRDCLAEADELGVTAAVDRKVFAYLKMSAGREVGPSAEITELAKRAVGMQKPLVELLEESVEQGNQ